MQNEVAPWHEHPASLREAVELRLIEAYQRARASEASAYEIGLTAHSDELRLTGNAMGMAIDVLRGEGGTQEWRESAPVNREQVYAVLRLRAQGLHKDFLVLQGLKLLQGQLLKQIDAFVAAEKMLRDVAGE